jgi:hypothetical protein
MPNSDSRERVGLRALLDGNIDLPNGATRRVIQTTRRQLHAQKFDLLPNSFKSRFRPSR